MVSKDVIMKKLVLGMMVLGSLSSFASSGVYLKLKCDILKFELVSPDRTIPAKMTVLSTKTFSSTERVL